MTVPESAALTRAFPLSGVVIGLSYATNIEGVALPALVEKWPAETLARSLALALDCRLSVVTLMESAEASVQRNRATTSDKEKQLVDKIDPPKPHSNSSNLQGRDV